MIEVNVKKEPIYWKEREKMVYTWYHRKAFLLIASIDLHLMTEEERLEMIRRAMVHDLDKMYMYTFMSRKEVRNIHRMIQPHHLDNTTIPRTEYDYLETLIDWNSNRYTKKDKPELPFEIMKEHFPNAPKELKEKMKQIGLYGSKIKDNAYISNLCRKLKPPTNQELKLEAIAGYYIFTEQIKKFGNNFVFEK